MATEKIILETEVKLGNSGNSVKGLKQELRDLTKQLGTLDKDSKSFQQAAQRAGQLRDQIRGVNDAIENADPEKKFAPFVRTIGGLAGGFSAVQGAMALFGAESEDLQKTLVKVQGAMALSQGLNSMIEFKNDFAELGNIIKNKVITAFTTLRGAIMATGLGALAVLIGVIATNWDKFINGIEKAFPSFKKVTDFFQTFRQVASGVLASVIEGFKVVGDVITNLIKFRPDKAIAAAKEFGTRTAQAYNEAYQKKDEEMKLEAGLKNRKLELDLEEAKGKDILEKRVKLLQDELKLLDKGSEDYNNKLIEIEKTRTEIRKKAEDKRKENADKAKKAEEDRLKKLAELYKIESDIAAMRLDNAKKAWDETKNIYTEEFEEIDKLRSKLKELVNDDKESLETRQLALDEYLKAGYISQKEYDEASILLTNKKKENTIQAFQATSTALMGFAALAGEQTATGKTLAIASTTIDTYLAAQRAYTSALSIPFVGAILAPIAAGGAIAAGLARVRAIMAVQIPNGGGGGGAMPSAPSAPSFNPISQGIRIQGANEPIVTRNIRGQDNRVYVLESDITDKQNTVEGIKQKATVR